MAIQTIPGGLYIPAPPGNSTTTGIDLRVMLLDASSEKAGGVFRAPKTGTIAKVGFVTGTVTTGATVDVRLETVSLVNGDPTGTLLGANSNGAQVIDAADDNTWFLTSLTTGVAVTKGDLIAVVIANAGSGNMNIMRFRYLATQFPYSDFFTASWAKNSTEQPNFALEYDDGSYARCPGVYPFSSTSDAVFNNTDTPDERGLKFKLPFDVEVSGCWFVADLDGPTDVVLYDSDDSVLETISLDPDVRASTGNARAFYPFDGEQTLTKNVFRRLVLKPTTATDITLTRGNVDAAAIMDSLDGGQDFHHTERTDGGAWTDTTTSWPYMGLICSGFDDGASVGGDTVGNMPHQATLQVNQIVSY